MKVVCTDLRARLKEQQKVVIHPETPKSGKSLPPAGLMDKSRKGITRVQGIFGATQQEP